MLIKELEQIDIKELERGGNINMFVNNSLEDSV
jgi:hypothetical protein